MSQLSEIQKYMWLIRDSECNGMEDVNSIFVFGHGFIFNT